MAHAVLEKQPSLEDVLSEVSRIKSVVSDAVEDGVEAALRAVKQGRDAADNAVHDARYAIKRNPFQAVGIVFAAGIVVGGLMTLLSMRRD